MKSSRGLVLLSLNFGPQSQPPMLESRGPGTDPFRASGPKWGRKWPKNGFWPHLKKGEKMAQKMTKMAWKMEKMARKRFENGISGHFPHFPGHVSPTFQVRPKSIFRPFSSPEARNGCIPGPRDSNPNAYNILRKSSEMPENP